ncbi:hypothetical protein CIK52_16560 [Kocuria rosea]|uniref:hypothetical protein n=1 Tax=Kocuria rosea TaxID=1275 RepID=UPI000D64A9E5|nr:hypothetical protein [Kocuria rosea]MEB2528516.1 hypothetical protein [Kocuria rosea]MEB2619392.1 hypothetical protein [Kocuria rosea]PWF82119.1 hypothetical protein CIK52_16560 [Kocuria rosea]QCY31741.1 hypothetical protein EQG70_01750 [Kocuria rosea]TQN39165.1 hypothetical protein FHX38_1003 [Kocuria rosea]
MDHKLSVLVQIDLHGAYVRLIVTGCVTEANQHALHPLVARARTLIPPVAVTVDLTTAEHVEAGAVDLLRWALEHNDTATGPVEVLTKVDLPTHQPAHRPVTALANHRARAGALRLLPRSA